MPVCPACKPYKPDPADTRTVAAMALYGLVAAPALIFRPEAWQPFTLVALLMVGLLAGAALTTVVHELGHAAAAALAGFRVTAIDIGAGRPRFVLRRKGFRFTLKSYPLSGGMARIHAPAGATRPQRAFAYAGGAFANLAAFATGSALLARLASPGHQITVEPYVLLVGAVGAQGLNGLTALWPKRVRLDGRDHLSDGALLLKLLRTPHASRDELISGDYYEISWLGREGRFKEQLRLARQARERTPELKYLIAVMIAAIGELEGDEAAVAFWEGEHPKIGPWGETTRDRIARGFVEANAAWYMARSGVAERLPTALELSERAVSEAPDAWAIKAVRGAVLVAAAQPAAGLKLMSAALRHVDELHAKAEFCPWLARAERECGRPELAAEYERLEAWLRRRHARGA